MLRMHARAGAIAALCSALGPCSHRRRHSSNITASLAGVRVWRIDDDACFVAGQGPVNSTR